MSYILVIGNEGIINKFGNVGLMESILWMMYNYNIDN